jgi:Flp pilus assembly protein TadD
VISAASEVNVFQSLTGSQPEFQVSAPQGNRLFILSSINVKKTDSSVSLTWNDLSEKPEAASPVDRVLNRFIEEAEEQVRRYPESARALTNLAIALIKRGSLDRGIETVERAIIVEKRNYLALTVLAGAYFQKGQLALAEKLYFEMTDFWPEDPRPLVAAATLYLRRSEYDRAEELLSKAVALDDKAAATHFMLGVVRLNRSNIHKAITSLRVATHLDVRNPVYHHNLGVAYALAEEYERAEREFRMSLALSPNSAESVRGLGVVLLARLATRQTIDLLQPYVESHEQDNRARQTLARAYIAAGRHSLGRSSLKHVLNHSGENLDLLTRVSLINDLGLSFMVEGKPEEAEITLKRAIELGPDVSSVPYENLARTYLFYLDRPESAIGILQRAKELFPQAQITRILLARAFTGLDHEDWGVAELEPFWRDGIASRQTYASLGSLYAKSGNLDRALEVLAEGFAKYPKDADVINNLAYSYLLCGRLRDAKSVLATLPKTQELTPYLTATFGLLRLWEGHEKPGRQLYEDAQRLASEKGDRSLVRQIRQKMHLELAKFYARIGNRESAQAETEFGIKEGAFPHSFMKELLEVRAELETRR